MSRLIFVTIVLTTLCSLTGCEKEASERDKTSATSSSNTRSAAPNPSPSSADEQTSAREDDDKPSKSVDASTQDDDAQKEAPGALERAFEAPNDVESSTGRFDELMERGLEDHMPTRGLLYGAAGFEQPTLRIIVAPDGRVTWARGKGPYWKKLEANGHFELSAGEVEKLASMVDASWTMDPDYAPSSVQGTRVVIVRDGNDVRVFEHSGVPRQLAPLESLLRDRLPDR